MFASLPIKRRSLLLRLGALFTGSVLLPGFKAAAAEDSTEDGMDEALMAGEAVYIGESGNYKYDKRFVLGMLVVKQASKHEAAIANLRKKSNYRTRLTFSSSDRYKKAFVDDVVGYFMQQTDMKFVAYVYEWDGVKVPLTFGKRSEEKILFHHKLLKEAGLANGNGSVSIVGDGIHAKSQSAYGPSLFFRDRYKIQMKNELKAVNTHKNNLIQVAGFLTGCVLAEINKGTTGKTKVATLQSLRQALNIPAIGVGVNVPEKFKVIR